MAFLAPAFLALAALIGVPLLVHLLRRRVGRTVNFPAVRYLTRMEREHSRELKLRHRALLLLRLLAVLALALAAARPIAQLAGLGHAPIAVAIVLDNSLSASAVRDGRTVFDSLRADVRQLLDELSADDRVWVVTADGRVNGGTIQAVRAALEAIPTLGGRGDVPAALRRAIGLARSGAPRSPVVALISDGQRSAFDSSVVTAGDIPVVALAHAPFVFANRAVLDVQAEPKRWTPSGAVSAALVIPDSAAWRVLLDGRTVSRGEAGASSLQVPTQLVQRLASTRTGWARGSVEVDADALRGDNIRWFAVRVAPPPSVAVRPEGGPFLSAALATLAEEQRLTRRAKNRDDVVTVSAADASGVTAPALLTAPQDPVRIGEANRTLTRLGIPWRFGAIARNLVLSRSQHASPADTATPAAQAFDGTPVRLRYPLVYSPGADAGATGEVPDTLATAGGAPWVVAGNGFVLIGSPLDPDATDLPLRAAFVPWLLDALSRRLGEDGQLVEAVPGARIANIRGATTLERPDGTVVPLAGAQLVVPNEAGVYFFRRQAARIGALVVNPEPEESDVGQGAGAGTAAGVAPSAWLATVQGRTVQPMSRASEWRRVVLEQAEGRALLVPLLALALVALILEAWFASR